MLFKIGDQFFSPENIPCAIVFENDKEVQLVHSQLVDMKPKEGERWYCQHPKGFFTPESFDAWSQLPERNFYDNPSGKPYCCFEGCNKDATKDIRFSNELEDYTHSCEDHVQVLSEGKSVVITPIEETL